MAPDKTSLAFDWFAVASRSVDDLEQKQTQALEDKRRFRSELHAAQSDEDEAKEEKGLELYKPLPSVLTEVRSLPNRDQLLEALQILDANKNLAAQTSGQASPGPDSAQLARITFATYALALHTLFEEADRLQDSAWYWSQIQDSNLAAVTYLVQTLPSRLVLLAKESYRILAEITTNSPASLQHDNNISGRNVDGPRINRQTVAATIRQLRRTPDIVVGALWPHSVDASGNPDDDADSIGGPLTVSSLQQGSRRGRGGKALAGPLLLLKRAKRLSPLSLTVHEANAKAKLLARRRIQVAEQLGDLAITALELTANTHEDGLDTNAAERSCSTLVSKLRQAFPPDTHDIGTSDATSLHLALRNVLNSPNWTHQGLAVEAAPIGLSPPSRLSIIWPRLVLYPALLLVSLRLANNNREALKEALVNARETAKGFFQNWIVQPLTELFDTIRGGDAKSGSDGDGGSIVTKEGRKADLESLERMVTQYAVEKGQISPDDVARREALRRKVREGDLDVVMLAYEDQLKSPLKSLTVGSLPRLLLIQVQKAKYDLAVAMSGIDHLLKSQALLFGAVGIAPAMGILWALFKGGKWLVRGRDSASKGDVARQKERAWGSMRRVDRMLTSSDAKAANRGPRIYGSVLLELAAMRKVGIEVLSASSNGHSHRSSRRNRRRSSAVNDVSLRGGAEGESFASDDRLSAFLQDVRDLEQIAAPSSNASDSSSAQTSVSTKKDAIERMWRCWGPALFVLPTTVA